jgi:O-antigen ligase
MLWILLGYMFLFVHRPFEIWTILGDLHVERIYMLAALLVAAAAPGKRWLANWQHLGVLGLSTAVAVCWVASPWADKGQGIVEDYFKVLVFYLVIVTLVSDEKGLRRLVLGFLAVMFVYMSHSLWEYLHGRYHFRMGIPRLIGVDQTMGDPNSFGATLVYALPLVVPFWFSKPSLSLRLFLAAYLGLTMVCIGLTGSRGSFLALLLCMAVLVWFSRYRVRLGALALLAAPLLFAALPASLQNRFTTIIDPSVGPANAQESAEGRLVGFVNGMKLFSRFPLTGCGPGAWKPATGTPFESHCLYGQVPGEMGLVGIAGFASLIAAFAWNVRQIRRAYRQHPEWGRDFLYQLTLSLGTGIFLLLVLGAVGHNLYRYTWLWYAGFLVIVRHCVAQRLAQARAPAPAARAARPFLLPVPPRRRRPRAAVAG